MIAPTSHRRPSAAGFTLVELLAVLVLLGIGVSLVVPRMDGFAARQKTRAAVDGLRGDLAYARILAVRWGRPTSVRLSASGTQYTVTVDTAGTASANFRTVKTVRVNPGVQLAFPASQVSFSSRGFVANGTGHFTATRGTMVDSIQLYPTGRTASAN